MRNLLLITHFLGVTLGVGTGFAMMALGIASKDMAPADRAAFMRRASAVGVNGSIGLLLLILSGLGLVYNMGLEALWSYGPAVHAKLTLVAVLIGCFGYMQVLLKKFKAGDAAAAATIPTVSKVMLLVGVAIIVAAVLAFQ